MTAEQNSNPSVINEGDLVEAARGEEMHRGRTVVSNLFAKPRLFIASAGNVEFLDVAEAHGWTLTIIERAKPVAPPVVLPTVPGMYSAPSGSQNYLGEWHTDHHQFYFLNTVGKWCDLGWGDPAASAELTLLRPVHEVVEEALAEVKERAIARTSDTITIRHLVMENIGDEMGVTS